MVLPPFSVTSVVSRRMLFHTVLLVVFSLLFWPVAHMGLVYGLSAVVLGALFAAGVIDLGRDPTPKRSMRVFGFSITYVTLLFGAMVLDVFVR